MAKKNEVTFRVKADKLQAVLHLGTVEAGIEGSGKLVVDVETQDIVFSAKPAYRTYYAENKSMLNDKINDKLGYLKSFFNSGNEVPGSVEIETDGDAITALKKVFEYLES